MKKFFFMAMLNATAQGRPIVQFNTVTALDQRNIAAKDLEKIQTAGAQMLQGQVQFDDLVIQNIFFLGEMTHEEFTEGTSLREHLGDALAGQEAEAGEKISGNNPDLSVIDGGKSDLEQLETETVTETPVEDVTTAEVKTDDPA